MSYARSGTSPYTTIATYNATRKFGTQRLLDLDNQELCITNPACAPSFDKRTQIHTQRQQLFEPIDRTIQKDVWGPGTCCLRQSLLQTELDQGWTVFQRRTFRRTPVLWMHEANPSPPDEEEF